MSDDAKEHEADVEPELAPQRAARKLWPRRLAVTGVVVVLIGIAYGIGEIAAISAQHSLSQVRGQLSAVRNRLDLTQTKLIDAQSQLTSEQAQVQAARAAAAQANQRAQARYAAAEAKLAKATRAYHLLIGEVQASAISADGVYVVGHDIKSGTWHTSGDGGQGGLACYFATLGSTDTSNIIDNNNFDGPETVNVNGAYAFQISGPCTWYRIGA